MSIKTARLYRRLAIGVGIFSIVISLLSLGLKLTGRITWDRYAFYLINDVFRTVMLYCTFRMTVVWEKNESLMEKSFDLLKRMKSLSGL